jgi:maltose O-acetyltransferase
VIGDDFALACTFGTVLLAAGPGGAVTIGDGVTINYGSAVAAAKLVTIGDRVMIGPYCVIEDGDDPSLEDERQARPVVIEEDVWLAGRVVVRPGVRIGAGTVVAAGSVVETDLPANALASGSPARVLRVRDAGRPPESGLRTLDIEAVEARRVAAR